MRTHSANELNTVADILTIDADTDIETLLSSGVPCGPISVSGRRQYEAQFTTSETTHMILMRFQDSALIKESAFVRCEGVLYVVDYLFDAYNAARAQRPRVWTEVYCHITRTR
jgi:hypothetical protein